MQNKYCSTTFDSRFLLCVAVGPSVAGPDEFQGSIRRCRQVTGRHTLAHARCSLVPFEGATCFPEPVRGRCSARSSTLPRSSLFPQLPSSSLVFPVLVLFACRLAMSCLCRMELTSLLLPWLLPLTFPTEMVKPGLDERRSMRI